MLANIGNFRISARENSMTIRKSEHFSSKSGLQKPSNWHKVANSLIYNSNSVDTSFSKLCVKHTFCPCQYPCLERGYERQYQVQGLSYFLEMDISLEPDIACIIIMYNPGIQNPGPSKHFSVLYQNVRGCVPFSGLGEKIMPFDSDKI